MIRALVFDFGGVLMRTLDDSGRRKWEERLGLGAGGADALVFGCSDRAGAQLGAATDAAVWDMIGAQCGLDAQGLAEFREDFWRGDRVNRELVEWIRALRPRYKIGLLSNMWDTLRPLLARADLAGLQPGDEPLASLFDAIVISCEEGRLKPDPELYRRALARLDAAPAEAVFVDDVQANVDGARAVGMQALRFTSTDELVSDLRAFGVEAPC